MVRKKFLHGYDIAILTIAVFSSKQSMDDELFNPDYVEVDRVLEESHTIDPNTQEEVTHYLVKWRSLPYEDSTWELQQDVDPEKVKQFKIYSQLPPEDERGVRYIPDSFPDKKCLMQFPIVL